MADVTMKQLLAQLLENNGSDIHVSAGAPPQMRVDGSLKAATNEILDPESSKRICYEILTENQIKTFEKEWELDCAIDFEGRARFRVNILYQLGTVAAALRIIPTKMPDAKMMGIPEAAMKLTTIARGLVLVTGPTGSGKSTTLAAMVNTINEERDEHIITIEDPVEFIHTSKSCLVAHREVGRDTLNFGAALKRILRQDPDIVLVGEMRDLETIGAAITISETGHLVFGTLHTNTAVQTINRIIDVFPSGQQAQVRTQLSFILQGVLSQQLIPKIGGGRCLAMEILIPTMAIRNLIREDKVHQMGSAMQMNREKTGMQTMNQCLFDLYSKNLITKEDTMSYATDFDEMEKLINTVSKPSLISKLNTPIVSRPLATAVRPVTAGK